jgi:type IV secretory pathway VirB9-like protein
VNRKQRAMEDKYKSQGVTPRGTKPVTHPQYNNWEKYNTYRALIVSGDITRSISLFDDEPVFYQRVSISGTTPFGTVIQAYSYRLSRRDVDYHVIEKAWDDYHNSPLIKALS